ncbi:hypothetical protein FLAVO9AF_100100 [Flavobacterium sp. 9AF]|uniref:hypothetical protein n=1 Tax=Flavobacterium sp. 9AF TaxID=2653142 RepID=UPI0012F04821|nr:hypothetical protein [Flavobacterium sp. 9AF]VXB05343.1 hypothetical protein FLAVO9AF_100100 [Flavobacterium sp. 9AF]
MKKKPHQKQSVIQTIFSNFRKRLILPKNHNDFAHYEIKKQDKGYSIIIYNERDSNRELFFNSKEELDRFIKTL